MLATKKLPRSLPLCAVLLAAAVPARAANYVVTSTADTNATGTLRWAVNQANAAAGFDVIAFNIPGSGIKDIVLGSQLVITQQVAIDGTTQPGYAGLPRIVLQGGGNLPNIIVFSGAASSSSTIQGLGLYNYTSNGVTVFQGSQGNWIQQNWIGFRRSDAGGVAKNTDSAANRFSRGVALQSNFNVIRGNTIAGVDNAIVIGEDVPTPPWSGAVYKTNNIQDNYLGCNPGGTTTTAYGNTTDAIFLGAGAQQNWIGPGNVIAGNGSIGVEMLHSSIVGNVVFKNLIGVNAAGTALLGNGVLGVLVSNGAHGNAIGGPAGGNTIAGNTLGGVSLGTDAWGAAVGNWVQYNAIGMNTAQTAALGGQQTGIAVSSGSTQNVIEGNAVGGHSANGIIAGNARSNGFYNNYLGRSSSGTPIGNGEFGIALVNNASYNFVTGNLFGSNASGTVYHDASSVGNVIR